MTEIIVTCVLPKGPMGARFHVLVPSLEIEKMVAYSFESPKPFLHAAKQVAADAGLKVVGQLLVVGGRKRFNKTLTLIFHANRIVLHTETSQETLDEIELLAKKFRDSGGKGHDFRNYNDAIVAEALRIAEEAVGDVHIPKHRNIINFCHDLSWYVGQDRTVASVRVRVVGLKTPFPVTSYAEFWGPLMDFNAIFIVDSDQKYNCASFNALYKAIIKANEDAREQPERELNVWKQIRWK